MAWQDELIPMLRVLIGDIGEEAQYSDKRLTDLIIASARIVITEIPLAVDYAISMATKTISPDPSADDIFLSLILLKSGCLVDQNTLRQKALMEGISAKLGPAALDVGGPFDGLSQLIAEGPCKSYKDLKTQTIFGGQGLTRSARAILSPFVGNKFDPSLFAIQNDGDSRYNPNFMRGVR